MDENNQPRRKSKFVTEEDPHALPDLEVEEIPSHRCLILDRSFEALKSARSSTDAMNRKNKELTERVHSEITKGESYEREVSDGKQFVYNAENDSVMKILRERDCEQQETTDEQDKQTRQQEMGEARKQENETEVEQETNQTEQQTSKENNLEIDKTSTNGENESRDTDTLSKEPDKTQET